MSVADGVNEGCDVPIGILARIETLVECTVRIGVAIAEDTVVDVPQSPDELALGVSGRTESLLDHLPLVGLSVIQMPGFAERPARV